MQAVRHTLILLVLLALSSGCSSMLEERSFMHPDADFSFYQKIGVLPFANQTDDALAGEKVTEFFMTELLINGGFEVIDPGQFNAVVRQITNVATVGTGLNLSPDQLRQISDFAGVQGILEGIVHEYKMVQLGGEQYPMMSLTVKFIDAPTGTVVWQSNVTARGGPNIPIVSVGESFLLTELTQKISRQVVRTFYKQADID